MSLKHVDEVQFTYKIDFKEKNGELTHDSDESIFGINDDATLSNLYAINNGRPIEKLELEIGGHAVTRFSCGAQIHAPFYKLP